MENFNFNFEICIIGENHYTEKFRKLKLIKLF
jgi:hypothetical protein